MSSAVARSIARAGSVGIHAPLEAHGGIRDQPHPPSAARHRIRREMRRLEQHLGGRLANGAAAAAHDAREADRPRRIRDHQAIRVERVFLAVEQHDALSRPRPAHADCARETRKIVGMQGLAQLHHDVVGHIDDGRDAAHTDAPQPLSHPGGVFAFARTPRITREAKTGHAAPASRVTGNTVACAAATDGASYFR